MLFESNRLHTENNKHSVCIGRFLYHTGQKSVANIFSGKENNNDINGP